MWSGRTVPFSAGYLMLTAEISKRIMNCNLQRAF